jgi:hypothetical protein
MFSDLFSKISRIRAGGGEIAAGAIHLIELHLQLANNDIATAKSRVSLILWLSLLANTTITLTIVAAALWLSGYARTVPLRSEETLLLSISGATISIAIATVFSLKRALSRLNPDDFDSIVAFKETLRWLSTQR